MNRFLSILPWMKRFRLFSIILLVQWEENIPEIDRFSAEILAIREKRRIASQIMHLLPLQTMQLNELNGSSSRCQLQMLQQYRNSRPTAMMNSTHLALWKGKSIEKSSHSRFSSWVYLFKGCSILVVGYFNQIQLTKWECSSSNKALKRSCHIQKVHIFGRVNESPADYRWDC